MLTFTENIPKILVNNQPVNVEKPSQTPIYAIITTNDTLQHSTRSLSEECENSTATSFK